MAPPRPPCGSPHGARAHTRRGEPVCGPCRDASRQWWRDYHAALRRIRNPGRELVDNTAAADAIRQALDRGCTVAQIAREAGYARESVANILHGTSARSQRRTVDAVIAACDVVKPTFRSGMVSSLPSSVRLKAMKDGGATSRWLAEQLQTSQAQLYRIVTRRHKRVTVDTEQKIAGLAAAISAGDIRPPGYAAKYGYRRCAEARCDRRVPDGEGVHCRACRKTIERRRAA